MGAVDLVVQVESPGSVASGLQRIGRAGHQVGAALAGPHLPQVPRRPGRVRGGRRAHARGRDRVDARAAQRRSTCSASRSWRSAPQDDLDGRRPARARAARLPVPRARARRSSRACSTCSPGRYPSDEFAELRPRLVWDRVGRHACGRARAPGASRSRTRARSPTAASTACTWSTAAAASASSTRRWCYEAREGQVFLLGATAWRIEEITRDRVIVSPAPGAARRDPVLEGRARSGGRSSSARARRRVPRELAALDDAEADGAPARPPRLRRARGGQPGRLPARAGGARPASCRATARIVVERFRDEIGDWRLCILSPFGGRVHAPWALALSALLRDAARHRDACAVVRRRHHPAPAGRRGAAAGRARGARPRRGRGPAGRRAGRLGAVRRALPRERRARAADPAPATRAAHAAVAAAPAGAVAADRWPSATGSFPIVLETYRELLQDHFDLPALRACCCAACATAQIGARGRSSRSAPRRSRSRWPSSTWPRYLYEDDTPAAERRVAGAHARSRPAARAARQRGAARPARRGRRRARRGGARPRGRARPPTRCTTCCGASATSSRDELAARFAG